jgi:hypothetical protein
MKIKMTKNLAILFGAVLLGSALPVSGESAPALDQRALAGLQRMSATLAAAKSFTYHSKTCFEVPAKNGQFLTYFSTARVALRRPDKLRAFLAGESPHFDFYYNGKTAAAFAPATNVYSVSKAPATVDEMLPALHEETGIRFASAGLLFSNPYKVLTRGLTSAVFVGQVTINGVPCDHLAFQSDGVNWEIWIESGPRALPQRLAVTYTDLPNFPRTLVAFSNWNLHPWLRSGSFDFHQPAGSKEIPFLSVIKPTSRQ